MNRSFRIKFADEQSVVLLKQMFVICDVVYARFIVCCPYNLYFIKLANTQTIRSLLQLLKYKDVNHLPNPNAH